MHRGKQYARAIQMYYAKYGRYPNTIDQLMKTDNQRFLRKRYLDPMTGKDDWRIIHFGEAKVPAHGLVRPNRAAAGGITPTGATNGTGNGQLPRFLLILWIWIGFGSGSFGFRVFRVVVRHSGVKLGSAASSGSGVRQQRRPAPSLRTPGHPAGFGSFGSSWLVEFGSIWRYRLQSGSGFGSSTGIGGTTTDWR